MCLLTRMHAIQCHANFTHFIYLLLLKKIVDHVKIFVESGVQLDVLSCKQEGMYAIGHLA